MNAADHYAHELTKRELQLMRVEAGLTRGVVHRLRDLERTLVAELRNADPSEVDSANARLARLQRYLAAMRPEFATTYRAIERDTRREMADLAEDESDYTAEIAAGLFGLNLLRKRLSKKKAAEALPELVTEGQKIRVHWQRQAETTFQIVQDQLSVGLREGESTGQLVRRLRGPRDRRGQYPSSLIRIAERNARTLVETITATVANYARFETFQANADLIEGLQAVNPLDSRTSPICRARAGNAWYLSTKRPFPGTFGAFPGYPPWHWRCRTTLIPIFKSLRLLERTGDVPPTLMQRIRDLAADKKAALDGKPAADLDFMTFFRNSTAAEQREMLGPGKLKLWQEKKLTFSQMIDQSGRPLTISELRERGR
jgi:SPP1 gp7 family putative phage head morphogenesis protein